MADADAWDTYCSEMLGITATPRDLDDELNDAVSMLESELRSPQQSYEENYETGNDITAEPIENQETIPNFEPEVTSCEDADTISTEDALGHQRPKERYITMIRDALLAADCPLTVSEIYRFIMDKYPYFRDNNILHWKNSVRHNLTAHAGKFFARTKGSPRRVSKSGKAPGGKAPIVWKLAYQWREMDSISNENAVPEATRERLKEEETVLKNLTKKTRKNKRLKASKDDKKGGQKSQVGMETSHSGDGTLNGLESGVVKGNDGDLQLTKLKSKKKQSSKVRSTDTDVSEAHEEITFDCNRHNSIESNQPGEATQEASAENTPSSHGSISVIDINKALEQLLSEAYEQSPPRNQATLLDAQQNAPPPTHSKSSSTQPSILENFLDSSSCYGASTKSSSTQPSILENFLGLNHHDAPTETSSISPGLANKQRDFVFFECQGVTCLGIPTPPSSVCSNTSLGANDAISPGFPPDQTSSEVLDNSESGRFPLLTSVLKEMNNNDLSVPDLNLQKIKTERLDITDCATRHQAKKPTTKQDHDSSKPKAPSQPVLDLDITPIPSLLLPLSGPSTPLHPDMLPSTPLASISPPPVAKMTMTSSSSSELHSHPHLEMPMDTQPIQNWVRFDDQNSSDSVTLNMTGPSASDDPVIVSASSATLLSKKERPRRTVKKRPLKKSSKSKMGRRSPPPLAAIKKPLARLVGCKDKKNAPLYFLLPAAPHASPAMAVTRFIVPARPQQQSSCIMMPVKTSLVTRPAPVINVTATSSNQPQMQTLQPAPTTQPTPAKPYHQPQMPDPRLAAATQPIPATLYNQPHMQTPIPAPIPKPMPNLTPIRRLPHRVHPWCPPVTEQLPQIAIVDLCQTLQHDEWNVNLELQPMFHSTILHGFDYEPHCLRPLPFENRFVLGDPNLLREPEILPSKLPLMLSEGKVLPADIICPPFLIFPKTVPNRIPGQTDPTIM